MLGAAERVLAAVVSQVEKQLLVLVLRWTTVVLHTVLIVVFLFFKNDLLLQTFDQLVWIHSFIILNISCCTELE